MAWDVGDMNLNLGRLDSQLRAESAKAVREIAEHVLGEATQIVPHEDGDLQDSGRVSFDDDNLRAAVSYDTPYAVVQHEDLGMKHDAGRTAKYLERPLTAAAAGPAQAIIKRRLGGVFPS